MKKRVFFQNAAIMTATSLILRTIGIFFRIYVSNRIGAEGMGLYQLIVSVYILVSSFATSGLTTAVTRLCTEELACGTIQSVKRVLYTCIWLSIAVGCASGITVYTGAKWIAGICLQDIRAISSLRSWLSAYLLWVFPPVSKDISWQGGKLQDLLLHKYWNKL